MVEKVEAMSESHSWWNRFVRWCRIQRVMIPYILNLPFWAGVKLKWCLLLVAIQISTIVFQIAALL